MKTWATRVTTVAFLALVVCAAVAQQPGYWNAAGGDPYAPQYQPQPNRQQPGQQPSPYQQPPSYQQPQAQPPANQPRYPLPGYAPANQPGTNGAYAPPAAPAVTNQTLRYPLPGTAQPTPTQPPTAPRPAPGANIPASQPPTAQQQISVASAATEPPKPQAILFQPGQIVGRVGDKSILYCDVAPVVNMRLEPILKKARSDREREAIESSYRDPLTKNVIDQLVFNKMLLTEFERGMPNEVKNDKKKRSEAEGKIRKSVRNAFDASLNLYRERMANATPEDTEKLMKQDQTMARMALLMKERHLESPGELDAALREYGTSLEQQARDYGEYMMGMEAARTNLGLGSHGGKSKPKEITHQELLDYYQSHVADYQIPAKARFEILTAKPSRFGGDRQQARQLIELMGNEVLLGGTPFPAVARKHSQEPHASEGGFYDWVTVGSLASKPIDQAIFTLEVGKLSQIIEDENGFHIVRVTERKDAGQVSFPEAQPEIRKSIDEERRVAKQTKYLADLRARTKVWTIYDPPAAGAGQPGAAQRQ